MAKKIEKQDDTLMEPPFPTNRRYIFFDNPPALWLGSMRFENHAKILEASGRPKEHVAAIGFVGQWIDDEVGFGDDGSSTLQIRSSDAQRCLKYLRSLPTTRSIKFIVR